MLDVKTTNTSFAKSLTLLVATAFSPIMAGCATGSSCGGSVVSACAASQCSDNGGSTGNCNPVSSNCTAPQSEYVLNEAPAACGTEGYVQTAATGEGSVTGSCVTASYGQGGYGNAGCDVPRELRKASLPEYRIEPPDVLLIEAATNLRQANAPVLAGEPLIVQVSRTIPFDDNEDPISRQFKTINGPYIVGTDGYLNLGPEYGKVHCAGQPLAEIQRRVELHLKRILTNPQVLVTLPDPSAKQAVAGQHLVRPDGTVGLGIYGGVYIAGMTLAEAKLAIEQHLGQHMHNPDISVDVLGYNSKVYYVIADGGGAGEQVQRFPSTGNETVLDAVAQIRGLPTVANKGQIWIARPSPNSCQADQILHVDWNAIAQGAQTNTNYQILPGDRLYVKADRWITFDTNFAKITAPFERILGFAILGGAASRSFSNNNNNNNNNNF